MFFFATNIIIWLSWVSMSFIIYINFPLSSLFRSFFFVRRFDIEHNWYFCFFYFLMSIYANISILPTIIMWNDQLINLYYYYLLIIKMYLWIFKKYIEKNRFYNSHSLLRISKLHIISGHRSSSCTDVIIEKWLI